ncbi:Short-chain dehydrogenase/reductase family 16C member 6 [Chelonia mydas]|uniref:Short-chain dehydrogenase/reductase family 16C member 6 n=1 Tax=Chelonia mydas TaxID=8469 RepID=M7BU83_CHEMY|nr:Short-chain dehydrogenase/reductase family 16C member 6 [Chelonia mydas]
MCKLNSILETLEFLILLGYYYFEAFVLLICPPCKKNVAGEIVLITGAANGIGRQIALNFARLGATLVFWDIDEEGNKETTKLAKENGAKGVYAYRCDCSNREEVYRVADQDGLEAVDSGLNSKDEVVDEEVELEDNVENTTGSSSGMASQDLFSIPEGSSQSQQPISGVHDAGEESPGNFPTPIGNLLCRVCSVVVAMLVPGYESDEVEYAMKEPDDDVTGTALLASKPSSGVARLVKGWHGLFVDVLTSSPQGGWVLRIQEHQSSLRWLVDPKVIEQGLQLGSPISYVRKEVGDVNILINDAGIANVKTFLDLPDADMEKTIRVNIMAQFWTCKAFLPAMIACNRGHLVSISSGTGLIGANKLTDYSASKFAIIGFLESLAFELQAAGKKGIKTTIVCPSFVNTELSTGIRVS